MAFHSTDDENADDEPLDDDDNAMRIVRPLDLGLALDGHHGDETVEDDGQDGPLFAQDGAEDGDGLDDDGEHPDPPGTAQGEPDRVWLVSMAERDEDGEWRLVGEPVPDARFDCMGRAHLYAENRNKRDFGKGFDWLKEPERGWIVVREDGWVRRAAAANQFG